MDYAHILKIAYPEMKFGMMNVLDYSTLEWSTINTIAAPSLDQALETFASNKGKEAVRQFRVWRDQLLRESDVYALPDFPHKTDQSRTAWMEYRAQLRDLTLLSSPKLNHELELDMLSVRWPVRPDQAIS
jgi:hypothetical protein